MPVGNRAGFDRAVLAGDEEALRRFARLCVRKGVTTATDLASPLPEDAVPMMLSVTGGARLPDPHRVAAAAAGAAGGADDRARDRTAGPQHRPAAARFNQDRRGRIDPGLLARLRAPGYYNGAPNGLWYTAPEQIRQAYELALANDIQIHTHTNGDEATELALECPGGRAAQAPVAGPPLHAAALPARRRRAVSPDEGAGPVREPVRQPPLLLGDQTTRRRWARSAPSA